VPGHPAGSNGEPVDDFDEFVRRRGNELRASFALATFLGIDPDDVLQETLIRAHRHYRRFADEDQLVAWCKTVGHNVLRKLAGKAHRRRERAHPNPLDVLATSSLPDAEQVAVENAELSRVLASLRPRHALVLHLDARGRTREEIAAELGISPTAAGMLLHRARKAAQGAWGKGVACGAWLALRARRISHDFGSSPVSAQTVVLASVVSFSMVSAHALPVGQGPAYRIEQQRDARPDFAPVSTLGPTVPLGPNTPRTPHAKSVNRALGKAVSTQTRRRGVPIPVPTPTPPDTCGDEVCVASCADTTNGDRVYLKPAGDPCPVHVTEGIAPVCENVPDNPGLGCQREGDPEWLVEPSRPVPQGDPL